MRSVFSLFIFLLANRTVAQVLSLSSLDSMAESTSGHFAVGGYVDSYYGYNFNKPPEGSAAYFVSSARHNEFTINLAYVDVRYRSSHLRARIAPAVGTYMDANYKNEQGVLKNTMEANVGVLISKSRKIWIDVGVLGSPYTNEHAISKNHLMYTRSFGPENVPYYNAGIKLSVPINSKLDAHFYGLNGWQVIRDNNKGKSAGTQLEYRPNKKIIFNWNTYVGDERSMERPDLRMRYFNDFYWIYKSGNKFSATSCFYFGRQQKVGMPTANWWQINLIGSYAFNKVVSLSGRIEHFNDTHAALYETDLNGRPGFQASSTGACINIKLHRVALLRFEARRFFSKDNVFQSENMIPKNSEDLLIGSLTAWF